MTRRTLLVLFIAVPLHAAADREAARNVIMIPVAGTVDGAFGTRFQTDLTIAERSPNAAGTLIDIYWLPADREGSAQPVTRIHMPVQTTRFIADVVRTLLNQTGLGTIILRAVRADGTDDSAGLIDAYARVWTPMPNGRGTMSQGIPSSTLHSPKIDDFQPIPGHIYGLRLGGDFRANVGIVNMSAGTMTFSVRVDQTHVMTVTLPPRSMTQRALPAFDLGPVHVSVEPHQTSPPSFNLGAWTAYGSSVDNIAGDAWFAKAQAGRLHQE